MATTQLAQYFQNSNLPMGRGRDVQSQIAGDTGFLGWVTPDATYVDATSGLIDTFHDRTGLPVTFAASGAGARATLADMAGQVIMSNRETSKDTLREQLVRWIVEYNMPGAALPYIWRARPRNESAEAETRKAKAGAAEAMDKALRAIVSAAAKFEDDAIARDYIVSFEITDQLSDKTIDALVAARRAFAGEADPAQPEEEMTGDPAMFSAERLKKKR